MNYALFPSPVYALSSWLDVSNLLFIGLLSLPCFSLLSHCRDLAGLLGWLLPHWCVSPRSSRSPIMGYCHLLENQSGRPEKLIPVPGSKVRPLKLGGWAVSWGSLQHKQHLWGCWGNQLHPGRWVIPKVTTVQRQQDCYTEQGCHAVGRLSFKYRSFQVISVDIQEDLFLPRVN